ncbi:Cw7 protein [Heracleum sosnowskyi]|uniref:Cw7 protein n=1 Tax=Heracleum sosnowskyi TaxID=360622 RepID=A0AAD8J1F3_9APIA|nr:Cw7 protein [Heracleum sosnowskyi]
MLRADGDAPSRFELLNMVKKHSVLLRKNKVDELDVSDVEKNHGFWHDVMELYFVTGKEARRRLDDDLIFFVKNTSLDGFEFIDSAEDDSPYFVRRWAPQLNNLVEKNAVNVDWRCSFYLNLIAHSSFSVTVLICSHQALHNYQRGETTSISPICKVVKTVYASPDRVNFHVDSRKEVETTPAYPDICFAVDDFDSTFDAMVLTDADHCFCVLLNAHGGAAFPSETISQECSSSDNFSSNSRTDPGKIEHAKVTLFSGFVSYQTVREASGAGKSGFSSLLSLGHTSGKMHKLDMKGPGGRGEVEVAVSSVLDGSMQGLNTYSSVKLSKKKSRISETVRKAATVASATAKHVYAAGASHSSDKMHPLKCCLMSISLPWECIAYDLFIQGSSTG